jgi:hypothetical protein
MRSSSRRQFTSGAGAALAVAALNDRLTLGADPAVYQDQAYLAGHGRRA